MLRAINCLGSSLGTLVGFLFVCYLLWFGFAMECSGGVPQFDGLVNENIYLLETGKLNDNL